MGVDSKELLAYTEELHRHGLASNESLQCAREGAKLADLKAQIPEASAMSGEEIKRLRDSLSISQTMLAHILGMTKDSVSKWERNEIKPSAPALRVLQILKTSGLSVFMAH